jgi:hypothetical protein
MGWTAAAPASMCRIVAVGVDHSEGDGASRFIASDLAQRTHSVVASTSDRGGRVSSTKMAVAQASACANPVKQKLASRSRRSGYAVDSDWPLNGHPGARTFLGGGASSPNGRVTARQIVSRLDRRHAVGGAEGRSPRCTASLGQIGRRSPGRDLLALVRKILR